MRGESSSSSDFSELDKASSKAPSIHAVPKHDSAASEEDESGVSGTESSVSNFAGVHGLEAEPKICDSPKALKRSRTAWDTRYIDFNRRFARRRRGRRIKLQLHKDEDFKSFDRPDMHVSDLVNYMGIWMSKGDKKGKCQPLNSVRIAPHEKVLYFQVDGVDESISNQEIFQKWLSAFTAHRTLPSRLIFNGKSHDSRTRMSEIDYSYPMGDEWAFSENPLHCDWIGGDQFMGRVSIWTEELPK